MTGGFIFCDGNDTKGHAPILFDEGTECPLCQALEALHKLADETMKNIADRDVTIESLTADKNRLVSALQFKRFNGACNLV